MSKKLTLRQIMDYLKTLPEEILEHEAELVIHCNDGAVTMCLGDDGKLKLWELKKEEFRY